MPSMNPLWIFDLVGLAKVCSEPSQGLWALPTLPQTLGTRRVGALGPSSDLVQLVRRVTVCYNNGVMFTFRFALSPVHGETDMCYEG